MTSKVGNSREEDTFGGVGFGRFIPGRGSRGYVENVPSLREILINIFSERFWIYGKFLTIGENIESDIANQVRTAQSNIALIAALWITVQYGFVYQFPSIWEPMQNTSYIASQISSQNLVRLHDFYTTIALISLTSNTVACLYSVIVIVVLGEFSSLEMSYVNLKLGQSLHAAFHFLFLGIATWCVKALIFQVVVCTSLTAVIITAVVPVGLMAYFIYMVGVLLQCSYEVKMIGCCESKNSSIQDGSAQAPNLASPSLQFDPEGNSSGSNTGTSHMASPLFLSYEEIEQLLVVFGRKSDLRYLSEDIFLCYATHAARAKALKGTPKTEHETVQVLELCELSKIFARKVAADCLSAQLAAAMMAASARSQGDKCVPFRDAAPDKEPSDTPECVWRGTSGVLEKRFGWN